MELAEQAAIESLLRDMSAHDIAQTCVNSLQTLVIMAKEIEALKKQITALTTLLQIERVQPKFTELKYRKN